jgi:hypothetical protein
VPLFDNGQIVYQSGLRYTTSMANYLCRSCPRCNGYVGIVLGEPDATRHSGPSMVIAWGGGYRLAWIVIRGKRDTARGLERERRLSKWK